MSDIQVTQEPDGITLRFGNGNSYIITLDPTWGLKIDVMGSSLIPFVPELVRNQDLVGRMRAAAKAMPVPQACRFCGEAYLGGHTKTQCKTPQRWPVVRFSTPATAVEAEAAVAALMPAKPRGPCPSNNGTGLHDYQKDGCTWCGEQRPTQQPVDLAPGTPS